MREWRLSPEPLAKDIHGTGWGWSLRVGRPGSGRRIMRVFVRDGWVLIDCCLVWMQFNASFVSGALIRISNERVLIEYYRFFF